MTSPWRKVVAPLLASLTLGLAPFQPEPHLLGKIRWIAGGGSGMQGPDYFDLLLHGASWIWLILTLVQIFVLRKNTQ
ncbi:MAG: hypothetical protein AAFQ98_20290 [Bacteroidota bacterium]